MGVEFDALVKQGTWTLVPYNPAFHLVGCKWVYKVKQRADGTMHHFKARLVAKGYNQSGCQTNYCPSCIGNCSSFWLAHPINGRS